MRFDTFHSAVRPTVTYLFAGAMVAGFFIGCVPPDVFFTIAASVIGFWFGQRAAGSGRRRSE